MADPTQALPNRLSPRERFLRACRRQPVDRPPVWLMRQAGRYLPEYQALRAKHDFLDMCHTPALAREVTLQPIRRFDMDAAILFSDILVLPEALGLSVAYPTGGPTLTPSIRSAEDVRRLDAARPGAALEHVAEALRQVRTSLGQDRALLGFAGAPYTLATYMIEGETTRHAVETRRLAYRDPPLMDALLDRLVTELAALLRLQVEAGADAVQIFDTWAGDLPPAELERFALAPARKLFANLRTLGVPLIYYINGVAAHLDALADLDIDVLSVDWRIPLANVLDRTGGRLALQGNIDPLMLFAPLDRIAQEVQALHGSLGGRPGHILNLGHGVLPTTPLDAVSAFVGAAKGLTQGLAQK